MIASNAASLASIRPCSSALNRTPDKVTDGVCDLRIDQALPNLVDAFPKQASHISNALQLCAGAINVKHSRFPAAGNAAGLYRHGACRGRLRIMEEAEGAPGSRICFASTPIGMCVLALCCHATPQHWHYLASGGYPRAGP